MKTKIKIENLKQLVHEMLQYDNGFLKPYCIIT